LPDLRKPKKPEISISPVLDEIREQDDNENTNVFV